MRLAYVLVCVLAGCAAEPDSIDDEVEIGPDAKADTASELAVRTGETTVWMRRELERRGDLVVMRGRASRNITDGMGFIIDDPYGDFAARTVRTFEVSWPVSSARTLVDGVDQFVRLQFAHSNGRPDALTARAIVRPRFATFSGSPSIYLTAELTPVVDAGLTVYRAKGKTTTPASLLALEIGGEPHPIRQIDATHFEIDLAPHRALQLAGGTTELALSARLASGTQVTKRATLGLAIKKLALTAGDPYDKFPRPDCPAATRSCLLALPDGALDLASCGEAFVVSSCARHLGVVVDEVAVQAAIASGHATALVGADRVEQLIGGAEQTLDDRVSQVVGRWLLTPTARASVLSSTVDGALAEAYVHPLDLVEPVAPAPGDPASIRAAAADTLLHELARFDFLHGELARTYPELVAAFRAQHVQSLREFRETNAIEPFPGMPDRDVIVGQWLGLHVELSISKTTGAVIDTLIEID